MSEKKLEHIGFILDGNRRWAKSKGLPTLEGHRKGYETVKFLRSWCKKRGISIVTVYAFSTENWKRSEEEVGYLMDLLLSFLEKDIDELHEGGIKVQVIGSKNGLSEKILKAIDAAHEKTKNNEEGILQVAINYGGRLEMVEACQKVIELGVSASEVTEDLLSNHLYTAGVKDPDLIVRTSGEQRLSGFLLWQSCYSELLFLDKNWPDFCEEDLDLVIKDFYDRERRYGK